MGQAEREAFFKNVLSNINDLSDGKRLNLDSNKKFDLINISDMKDLLGYSDMRSVRSFCIANKVPLLNIGKKTYTIANFLQIIIFHQLNNNYPEAAEILKSLEAEELLKTIKAKETLKAVKNNDAECSKKTDNYKSHNTRQKIDHNVKNSPAAEKLLRMLDEA